MSAGTDDLRLRCNNHGDMISLEPGLLLHGEFSGKRLGYLVEDLHAEFGPDNLSALEEHGNLRFMALIKETPYIPHLEPKVVLGNLGSDFDLFHPHGLFLCMFLAHLIPVLSEIEYFTDRGSNIWRYFHKVELSVVRNL